MSQFLEQLAQPRPDPGGGAAAAYGATLALALLEKIILLEGRRHPQAPDQARFWTERLEELQRLQAALFQLRQEDVQAYFQFSQARAGGAQGEALAAAALHAFQVPRQIMDKCLQALDLAWRVGQSCKRLLFSDLLVVAEFLEAGLQGAGHIARANLPLIPQGFQRDALSQELYRLTQQGDKILPNLKTAGQVPSKSPNP